MLILNSLQEAGFPSLHWRLCRKQDVGLSFFLQLKFIPFKCGTNVIILKREEMPRQGTKWYHTAGVQAPWIRQSLQTHFEAGSTLNFRSVLQRVILLYIFNSTKVTDCGVRYLTAVQHRRELIRTLQYQAQSVKQNLCCKVAWESVFDTVAIVKLFVWSCRRAFNSIPKVNWINE